MPIPSDNDFRLFQSSYEDFDYYTLQAMRTMATYRDNDEKILNATLGLAGESAEIIGALLTALGLVEASGKITEIVKKLRHHGHPFTDEVRKVLLEEVGDILWYSAEMAVALHEPLSAIARNNVKKLMERYPEGFSSDRSLNRPETYEGDVRNEINITTGKGQLEKKLDQWEKNND